MKKNNKFVSKPSQVQFWLKERMMKEMWQKIISENKELLWGSWGKKRPPRLKDSTKHTWMPGKDSLRVLGPLSSWKQKSSYIQSSPFHKVYAPNGLSWCMQIFESPKASCSYFLAVSQSLGCWWHQISKPTRLKIRLFYDPLKSEMLLYSWLENVFKQREIPVC